MIVLHLIYIIVGALKLKESDPSEPIKQSEIKDKIEDELDRLRIVAKEQEKEKRKRKKTGTIITISISSINIAFIIIGLIKEISRFRSAYSSLIIYSSNVIGLISIFINLFVIISFS